MPKFKSKEDYKRWKEERLRSEGMNEQVASQADSMQIERTSYEEDSIEKKQAAASEAARNVSEYYTADKSEPRSQKSIFMIALAFLLVSGTAWSIYHYNYPDTPKTIFTKPQEAMNSSVMPLADRMKNSPEEERNTIRHINSDIPARAPISAEVNYAMTSEAKGKKEICDKAQALVGANDFVAAEALLRDLPEAEPCVLTYKGICRLNLGDYSEAIASLEKAANLNPRDFEARKALALAYYKIDNLPQSLLHTNAALSLKNDQQLLTLRSKLERENRTQKDFIAESSDHFKIQYDGYAHGSIDREVLSLLEDAYRHVGKELGFFPAEPVTVILYTDRAFFDTTQVPYWAGGLYDGKIRLPVKGATGSNPLLAKVIFHEYTHVVVSSITKKCPLWLNEGLAEYLSTTYPGRIGQIIPLKYLETSFTWLKSPRDVAAAYQESWSAVSYLVDRHGMYRVKGLLVSLGEGTDPEQAFSSSIGIPYKDFLSGWGKN